MLTATRVDMAVCYDYSMTDYADTDSPDEFDADLADYLFRLGHDDALQVERVFKISEAEVTELVSCRCQGAEGDTFFVRKLIDVLAGIGNEYEALKRAQDSGRCFDHLPHIYEVHRSEHQLYVLMEYIDALTLGECVESEGPSEELAARVMPGLCDAVAELHTGFGERAGSAPAVIHRDLTPSNIMVLQEERTGSTSLTSSTIPASRKAPQEPENVQVKLIDLGIARTWRDGADTDTVKFGTRAYAPPEQYGYGQTSVRSDVYALGGLLLYCLTGEDPKPGLTAAEVTGAMGVSKKLANIIVRAMAFDPRERYTSAPELKRAIATALGSSAPTKRKSALPPSPVAAPVWSHPAQNAGGSSLLRPLRSVLAHVPSSVGVMWNALLLAVLVIFIAGSASAVFEPTGANLNEPVWLLAVEYFFMLDVWTVAIAFVLLDKRRLRSRFPALQRLCGISLARVFAIVFVVPFCITLVLALAFGNY